MVGLEQHEWGGAQQGASVHGSDSYFSRSSPGTHGITGLHQLAPLHHQVHGIAPPKLVPASLAAVQSGALVINLQGLPSPPQLHRLLHSLSQLYGSEARCALLPPVAGEACVGVLQQGADLVCRAGTVGIAWWASEEGAELYVYCMRGAMWQQQACCTAQPAAHSTLHPLHQAM